MSKETAVDWLVDAIRSNLAAGKLNAVFISGLKMHAKAIEHRAPMRMRNNTTTKHTSKS
jgi:hypothetical protein